MPDMLPYQAVAGFNALATELTFHSHTGDMRVNIKL